MRWHKTYGPEFYPQGDEVAERPLLFFQEFDIGMVVYRSILAGNVTFRSLANSAVERSVRRRLTAALVPLLVVHA